MAFAMSLCDAVIGLATLPGFAVSRVPEPCPGNLYRDSLLSGFCYIVRHGVIGRGCRLRDPYEAPPVDLFRLVLRPEFGALMPSRGGLVKDSSESSGQLVSKKAPTNN